MNQGRMILMALTNLDPQKIDQENDDVNSLKGALFSSIIFVGGGIVFFIVLLFVFYMTRV
jgi:hypothetical protein